jgi:hypothetical protein
LPAGTPGFREYYDREQVWSADVLARREALLPAIEAYQASKARGGDAMVLDGRIVQAEGARHDN